MNIIDKIIGDHHKATGDPMPNRADGRAMKAWRRRRIAANSTMVEVKNPDPNSQRERNADRIRRRKPTRPVTRYPGLLSYADQLNVRRAYTALCLRLRGIPAEVPGNWRKGKRG